MLLIHAVMVLSVRAGQDSVDEPVFSYRRVELKHCVVLSTCAYENLAALVGMPDEMFAAVVAVLAPANGEPAAEALEALSEPKLLIRVFCERGHFQKYAESDRPAFVDFGGYATDRQVVMWRQDTQALDARRLAHEMVHAVLMRSVPGAPWWLHEGLARDFASFRYRPLNYAYSPFLTSEALHMLKAEREREWIPLAKLLTLAPEDLYGQTDDEEAQKEYRRLAYAESWALVYYLRRERSLKLKRSFHAYLDRLREGYPSLGAFREVLGPDLGLFEKKWLETIAEWYRDHSRR